jgi:hypothetical protein
VKSASLGKVAHGEPVLAPLFARALHEIDPGLGSCLAVAHWEGGDETLEQVALERADALIAYGGMESVESLRQRAPRATPFHAYGHRLSFGVVSREALVPGRARRVADDAAGAVADFDQHGCVSPHLFYVEEGGAITPREWAILLAKGMGEVERELPRGEVSAGEAAAIRQLQGEAEIAKLAGTGMDSHTGAGTTWTVLYDPAPEFTASSLNRTVRVKPIASLAEVPVLVAPLARWLQTVGIAALPDRFDSIAAELGRLGVSRIASLADMAWPPPAWHHDGRPALTDLVRWCDWEP